MTANLTTTDDQVVRLRAAAQLVIDVWQGNGGRKDDPYYKAPILTLTEGRAALNELAQVLAELSTTSNNSVSPHLERKP